MKKKTKCYLCGSEPDKIAIGLNKKMLGRNTARFYCLACFAEYLDVTIDDLLAKVEDFKLQGCTLFD